MRRLAWHSSFLRALKTRTRHQPALRQRILTVVEMMSADPFQPRLKTHKLHGILAGLWACWVEWDCRIIFALEPDAPREDLIVLIDLGTHDEVY